MHFLSQISVARPKTQRRMHCATVRRHAGCFVKCSLRLNPAPPHSFGMMAAQMKAFFDATGGLWQKGALHGKPASMFTSNAIIGGGQETAILTAVTQLAHHGMIYVPPGYGAGGIMFNMDQVRGGSAWGPSTIAGLDCARRPTEGELAQAAFLVGWASLARHAPAML